MNPSCTYLKEIKYYTVTGRRGERRKKNGYIIFGLKYGKIHSYPVPRLDYSDYFFSMCITAEQREALHHLIAVSTER